MAEKKADLAPVVIDVTRIKFDVDGSYQIEEITEAEWLDQVAGAKTANVICPGNVYCPQKYWEDGDGIGDESY